MSQYFAIHPTNPQRRLLVQAANIVRQGGLAAIPTDTTYALVCHLEDKAAITRLRRLRGLSDQHLFTLLVADLSALGQYAKVDNSNFRLLKRFTPGPFTFVLSASREVPRRLLHPKRKTVGLRVPAHPIVQGLLEQLGEPLLTSTLRLPDDELPITDPEDARDRLGRQVDLVVDGGHGGVDSTTVVNLTEAVPTIERQGVGEFRILTSP